MTLRVTATPAGLLGFSRAQPLTLGLSRTWKPGWVGTRRVAFRHVSSSPPLRTGLAAFTASGSTPLVNLHGATMKHLFPFRRHPQDFTRVLSHFAGIHENHSRGQLTRSLGTVFADSLCTPYFQRLGAFAKGSIPRVDGVTVLRLLRPIRHSSQASG